MGNSQIKRTYKTTLEDLNLEEARGWIIDRVIQIEYKINSKIEVYFKPTNTLDFQKYLLNSSILPIGSKLKILFGIGLIDKKLLDTLRKLFSIRDAFVHSDIVPNITIDFNKEKSSAKIESIESIISVMNANGEINQKNAKEYLKEFLILNNQIHDLI